MIESVIAFLVAFFTSQAGISGAFLLLPIQISLLGITSPMASSTNLAYNLIAIPSGVYRYRKEGRFLPELAVSILAGSIPGIVLGSLLRIDFMPESVFKKFVGIVLLYFGFRLVIARKRRYDIGEVRIVKRSLIRMEFEFGGKTFSFSPPIITGLSFLIGIVAGAYGVGGGALITPLLVTTFGLPIYVTAGATLLSTFVSSSVGVVSYTIMGYPPNLRLAFLFGIGGFAGMYCGARMQRKMSEKAVRIMLAFLVFALAFRYLLNS